MNLDTFGFLIAISIIASTLSITFYIVYLAATKKFTTSPNKLLYTFIAIFVGFSSFAFTFSIFSKDLKTPLICFGSYIVIIFAIKLFVLSIISRKSKIKVFKFYSIFYSPDFCLTDLQKAMLSENEKVQRSRLIKANNLTNLLISLILLLIAIIIKLTTSDSSILKILTIILKIRLVSRAFEIVISFCKDIYDKNKQSALQSFERIMLAVISLFELVVLYIALVFCIKCPNKAISDAIKTIIFGDVRFGFASSIGAIAGFSLVGTVITQYLSQISNDSNK